MGVIQKVKDYYNERGLAKLERNLTDIHERKNISFNPMSITGLVSPISNKNYSMKLAEKYVWFTGDISLLLSFYKKNKGMYSAGDSLDDYNYFWGNVPPENRRVHTKIPYLISSRMADLILGSGCTIEPSVLTLNEVSKEYEENEMLSDEIQQVVDDIYKFNNRDELFKKTEIDGSWSGDSAWKIIIDTEFSRYPIIQEVDARNYEIINKYGKTIGIVFKEYYEKEDGKDKYRLEELYTQDTNNDATISYKLFHISKGGKERQVHLSELEELNWILDNDMFDEETQSITFVGLKRMLAGRKPNKLPNEEFYNTGYGASDYAGCYSLFDSLDEIISTIIDDVRVGRSKEFIPESLIPTDNSGNKMEFNSFKLRYTKIAGSDAADINNKNEITHSNPETKTYENLENYKTTLMLVCNTSGISPLTIGITGLEAINTSDASQREREKVSIRTRNNKIKIWQQFLNQMTITLLTAYKYINEDQLKDLDLEKAKLEINVDFGDYTLRPFEDRLSVFGDALQKGSISIEEMVKRIYIDEKTDDEITEEINRLKMEKGISLGNEDNMLTDIF